MVEARTTNPVEYVDRTREARGLSEVRVVAFRGGICKATRSVVLGINRSKESMTPSRLGVTALETEGADVG